MSVVIETTLGDITVDLYVKERPKGKHFIKFKINFCFNSGFSVFKVSILKNYKPYYCYYVFTACTNFLKLCKMKYYNLNLFHSVQRGYIAQTGDPTGAGRGGESVFG